MPILTWRRLASAIVCSCHVLAAAPTLADSKTVWTHNGSLMTLTATGEDRVFHYLEPRPGMAEAGVKSGMPVFVGRIVGRSYVGVAMIYHPRCGIFRYDVAGPILGDDRRVSLAGLVPKIGSDCRIHGTRRDVLEFNYVRQGGGAPAAFPVPFRGVWKQAKNEKSECRKEDVNDSERHTDDMLQVEANATKEWESSCDLVSIKRYQDPDDPDRIKVELKCGGEGMEWRSLQAWRLAALDGRRLLLVANVKTWDHRDDEGTKTTNLDNEDVWIVPFVECK